MFLCKPLCSLWLTCQHLWCFSCWTLQSSRPSLAGKGQDTGSRKKSLVMDRKGLRWRDLNCKMEDKKLPALPETTKPKQQHSPCWCWRKLLYQFRHKLQHQLFLMGLDKAFFTALLGVFFFLGNKVSIHFSLNKFPKGFQSLLGQKKPKHMPLFHDKAPMLLVRNKSSS